jgi:hypothetical protein
MRRDTSVRFWCYCGDCGGSDPLETSETDCPLRGDSVLLADSIVDVKGKLIGGCPGLGKIQCLIDFKDTGFCIQRGWAAYDSIKAESLYRAANYPATPRLSRAR